MTPVPTLSVVPKELSREDMLYKIALTLNPKLTLEQFLKMLGRPELIQKLNAILAQRETAEAAQKAAEEQKAIDAMADALVKQANVVLNPVKPKEPVVLITREKIAEILPPRPPTLEERIEELKQKYGSKVPGKIFNHFTHEYAMGLRGAMIGVKMRFEEDLKKTTNNEEMRVARKNKCDSIQRFIDILTEIVKNGYRVDPTDSRFHAKPAVFNQVLSLLQTDPRLLEHCKLPETKAERESREKREAEEAQKAIEAKELALAERKKMVNALIALMMKVEHFQKLGDANISPIAERIVRKFSGSTPESRLKQAAQEYRGGDVKPSNRMRGAALALAAGMDKNQVAEMFPAVKQQGGKDKQKKQKNKR